MSIVSRSFTPLRNLHNATNNNDASELFSTGTDDSAVVDNTICKINAVNKVVCGWCVLIIICIGTGTG